MYRPKFCNEDRMIIRCWGQIHVARFHGIPEDSTLRSSSLFVEFSRLVSCRLLERYKILSVAFGGARWKLRGVIRIQGLASFVHSQEDEINTDDGCMA